MRIPFARACACACACALLCLPVIVSARPAPDHPTPRRGTARLVAGPAGAAKAAVDTVLLLGPHGSGAPVIGGFENAGGQPDWNGWTSIDYTVDAHPAWHASTFHAVNGAWSAWCGDPGIPSCGQAYDEDGGYGNNWAEFLEWRGTVADPAEPCTVSVAAVANLDTEPGYDYAYLTAAKAGPAYVDLWQEDGQADALAIAAQTVYQPGEYGGPGGDEVRLVFRFHSDGGFSGEDCLWPNDGAIQLDDVAITLSNGAGYAHDFEDGTLGDFVVAVRPGVGDFAKIWSTLDDRDPCRGNATPQVAFIDDGVVVPGTGGTECISWCYGPSGYVVNPNGGTYDLFLPYLGWQGAGNLDNAIVSPPVAWPGPDHVGARLEFDVYRHEPLVDGSPGIFYSWAVRSTASGDPADLADAAWEDRHTLYYGGPRWVRQRETLDDLIVPGATHVQVRLGAVQYGWYWGWDGADATPAPYLDNVRLTAWPAGGPSLAVEPVNLPTDAFPASGTVDLVDLGANSVPFATSTWDYYAGAGGDSVVLSCAPLGAGAVLTGPPVMHYALHANPVFDPYRTAGLPAQGSVACVSSYGGAWSIDLPDEGFLFPGDRLHVFFTATQTRGGATETAILPPDTTGFADFSPYHPYDGGALDGGYPQDFVVRALPSVREDPDQPGAHVAGRILFWHDSGTDADWDVWMHAFFETTLMFEDGVDVFHTKAAAERHRNGLGSRATLAQLGVYEDLFYTGGDQPAGTIDGGLFQGVQVSTDAARLAEWLALGARDLAVFGNDVAGELAAGDAAQAALLNDWFGAAVDARDVGPLIGGQTSPRVVEAAGNPVFATVSSWLAYGGGCDGEPMWEDYGELVRDRFDAVRPVGNAVRLAAWTDPGGAAGADPYAAALLRQDALSGSRTILVPTDFPLIRTDPDEGAKADAPFAARVRMLDDVIGFFGFVGNPIELTPVPGAAPLAAAARPNPFNPATTIAWTAARPAHLDLRIYDLRGRLVRVLHDGPAEAAGALAWDGRDEGGAAAASGVYFYELRHGAETALGKLTLVK